MGIFKHCKTGVKSSRICVVIADVCRGSTFLTKKEVGLVVTMFFKLETGNRTPFGQNNDQIYPVTFLSILGGCVPQMKQT